MYNRRDAWQCVLVEDKRDGALVEDEHNGVLVEDERDAVLVEDEHNGVLVEDERDGALVEDERDGALVEDKRDAVLIKDALPCVPTIMCQSSRRKNLFRSKKNSRGRNRIWAAFIFKRIPNPTMN